MPRDAGAVVTAFLDSVNRRLLIVDAVRAATAGLLAASGFVVFAAGRGQRSSWMWAAVFVTALATGGAMLWRARGRWSPAAAATLAEHRIPDSRNAIFTARELLTVPETSAPWIRRRVVDRAAVLVEQISVPAMVPVGRDVLLLGVSAVLATMALWMPQRLSSVVGDRAGGVARAVPKGLEPLHVTATVTPPRYTGIAALTVSNPDSLEVVEGGHIALAVTGAAQWSVRFGPRALQPTASGFEITPRESGYFAIERQGVDGDRRLVPVTVTPDRAPALRIDSPGKDLLMPAARGSIAIAASASDDYGLQSLELRYTKVTGSGEQFEFAEGVLPMSVTRESEKSWKASGSFDLARLGLKPGDSLVYRALARDGRPGSGGLGTSDTFFVEIAGPGQVALPGFELPPDRERYALSQQMIVLKLQRLRVRESSLSREALAEETSALAAEQRAVRANFIFLMGGQVEDEVAEAEQSSEIQEGRLENNARREINTAIRFMGQADQALVAVDTGAALPPAKSAVEALQRAFGRNRYFLRTLATRSRLDPSRRLTGDLKEASGWQRSPEGGSLDTAAARARSLLDRLLSLAADGGVPPATASAAIGALAEEALAVDPGSADWRRISIALTAVRDGLASNRGSDDIRLAVRDAVAPLIALSRKSSVRLGASSEQPDRLRSAWGDEARRR